ncbi:MAG: threonine--tRNA ligase [Actinomycetota bacterium]
MPDPLRSTEHEQPQRALVDHRRLGRELELFFTDDLIGAGLPVWLPRGASVRRALEDFIVDFERRSGFVHVVTPALGKRRLYEISGHVPHFQADMFPAMEMSSEQLVLRPSNCPHHVLVYRAAARSYRELPLRIAELGDMYRNERSGVLGGLSRVRAMTLNDAHVFCAPDRVRAELASALEMIERAYAHLGITDFWYRLSLRDERRDKYAGPEASWRRAEEALRGVLDDLGRGYVEAPGEAAFYGPKIDVQVRDHLERESTLSTVQVDFHLPARFELAYVGEDGAEHRPVMVHRSVVSTMERMVAHLVEIHRGALPPWLAPVQVAVLPVAERHSGRAQELKRRLVERGGRAEVQGADRTLGARVRAARHHRVPYVVVLGDREDAHETVSLRLRDGARVADMDGDRFVALVAEVNRRRSVELLPR